MEHKCRWLKMLHVEWTAPLWDARQNRIFDDYLEALREYKNIHGHCKVRRLPKPAPPARSQLAAIITTDTDKSSSNDGDESAGDAPVAMNVETESEALAIDNNNNNNNTTNSTNAANSNYNNISSGRLGEWVAKMRKEYDDLQHGKRVPNLTPERIAELNALGFVWRVRGPRPRKGDPNFRLRLNKTTTLTTTMNTNTASSTTTMSDPDHLPPSWRQPNPTDATPTAVAITPNACTDMDITMTSVPPLPKIANTTTAVTTSPLINNTDNTTTTTIDITMDDNDDDNDGISPVCLHHHQVMGGDNHHFPQPKTAATPPGMRSLTVIPTTL